jgi:hypothetical protein
MERSGSISTGAVRADDLEALAERAGPFATVSIALEGRGAYGQNADRARRKDVDEALAQAGAPESTRQVIDETLAGVGPDVEGVIAVADEQGVVHVERLAEAPSAEFMRWAALPSMSGVIEHRQAAIPRVVVLADRHGADIVVEADDHVRRFEADGATHPIRKSAPGGWSQRRCQQRVENTWAKNAGHVTEMLVPLIAEIEPTLVILGGDERAVDLIRNDLPASVQALTRQITSGRATDGSDDQRDDDIERLVRTAVAEDTMELIRNFEEAAQSAGRAANGADHTLAALRLAQVDTLLVHDDPADDRVGWFGTVPGHVTLDAEDITTADSDEVPSAAGLIDVAIHGALRTGAAIRVIPKVAAINGGIGAILRWSNS